VRQVPQVEHVAEHAGHQEEGRLGPAVAGVHGHQVGVARARGGAGVRTALGVCLWAQVLTHQRRAALDGGRLEEHRDGELHAVGRLDLREEAHRQQRVPAQVEEAVLHAHLVHAQQLLPEAHQRLLHLVARGQVVHVQVRARQLEAGCRAARALTRGALLHQRGQVHGAHEHLRQACGVLGRELLQHAAERVLALDRANALRQEPVTQRLARGGRVIVARVVVKGDVRGCHARAEGEVRATAHAPQAEALHLHEHAAARVHERHVEEHELRVGVVHHRRANPAQQLRREVVVDAGALVGHGHVERAAVVSLDEPHGPAGGDVEQRRVQPEALHFGRERGRQGQAGEPLGGPEASLAQHAPARAEAQVRLLCRAQAGLVGAHVGDVAARVDGCDLRGLERRRRGVQLERQVRLGDQHRARAAAHLHLPAHLETIATRRGAQLHEQLARLPVGHREGPHEEEVFQLEGAQLAVGAQRGARELEVAGAGDQRVTRERAVAVQDPVLRRRQRAAQAGLAAAVADARAQPRVAGLLSHGLAHARMGAQTRGLGRHAHVGPDAPVQRRDREAGRPLALGEGIQERVGGHVVHLPRGRRDRGGGAEQQREVEPAAGRELVQDARALDLGREHLLHALERLQRDEVVVQLAGRVEHAVQRTEAGLQRLERRLHLVPVGHVGREHQHLGAARLEVEHALHALAHAVARAVLGDPRWPLITRGQRRATQQREARVAGARRGSPPP
jgi:hypothetical protein